MTVSDNPIHGGPQVEQFEDVIEIFSDDYACRILATLETEGPMPAADLADKFDMSRPTVYRRLNQLETLGFVSSRKQFEPDGNHRKQFQLVLDEIRFEVGENGVDAGIISECDQIK
jgi:predicted ArsR family transcriptional regulator